MTVGSVVVRASRPHFRVGSIRSRGIFIGYGYGLLPTPRIRGEVEVIETQGALAAGECLLFFV